MADAKVILYSRLLNLISRGTHSPHFPALTHKMTTGAGSLVPTPVGPLGGDSCAIPYENENATIRPQLHTVIA